MIYNTMKYRLRSTFIQLTKFNFGVVACDGYRSFLFVWILIKLPLKSLPLSPIPQNAFLQSNAGFVFS